MSIPSISIIIPSYNSAKTILQTIQGVLSQTFFQSLSSREPQTTKNEVEIIVVDDGSTDNTPSIIQSFKQIKYIRQANAGPATARNRGVRESRGEIIFFTDADCIPESDWIEKMIVHFDDPKIAVVAGSYGIANSDKILARCIHREIVFRHKVLMPTLCKAFGSYNFCIRREIFDKVGGFDPKYRHASGEDNDLSYKIIKSGCKIYFEKNSRVKHYHPEHIRKYLLEQFRHGFWRVKMYRDHPSMSLGDGYTFWKDILEIPLVMIFALSLSLAILRAGDFSLPLVIIVVLFLVLEVIWGFFIIKSVFDAIFFSFIMFLRSFFRAFGFSSGFFCFFPLIFIKKSK